MWDFLRSNRVWNVRIGGMRLMHVRPGGGLWRRAVAGATTTSAPGTETPEQTVPTTTTRLS